MSSSTQDLLPHLDLRNTFGALFIGVSFAAVLFGVSNVQAFIYFQAHRGTEMAFYKLVVIGLWILDVLHLALIVHCVYYYLVTNYMNVSALTEIVWSFKLQLIINVLIIYVVHFLYAYRIWIVSKGRSRVLPITLGIIVILASGGVSIALVCALYRCHVFSDLIGIEWATFATFGTFTFVDFAIASSLCYLLATSHTGFSNTDSFLTKLMTYAINTGCLISISSMATLITCAVMPKNFIFLGIEFFIAKLYINSVLALLNARRYLQPKAEPVVHSDLHIRHSVYPPQLYRESQDDKLLAFRKFYPDDENLHPNCPVQVSCHNSGSVDDRDLSV